MATKSKCLLGMDVDGSFLLRVPYRLGVEAKAAGWTWLRDIRMWTTNDPTKAAAFARFSANGDVRAALQHEVDQDTYAGRMARAAERLPAGAIQALKAKATPEMAKAIREGVALMHAANPDKATVWNNQGFSKSDSFIGYALVDSGMKRWPQLAIAQQLCWKYRRQLGAALVSVAMGVVTVVESQSATAQQKAA